MSETRAQLSSAAINDLPDSSFAYIEPGGSKDQAGKTIPRSKRHFPVHDEAHARNALARAPQSPFGKQAMPRILSACKRFGVTVTGDNRSAFGVVEPDGIPERRFTRFPPEIRADNEHGPQFIYGYAAAFGKLSRKLGGFVEQVDPTAFNETKTLGWPDVVCRYNHRDDQLLGTTYARTLRLATDATGLAYEVEPPKARGDVLEYVQRGDIRHSSFAFRVFPGGDEWGVSEFNYPMRTLMSVQLVDVAPVLDPAYPDATAGARALNGAVQSLADWVQTDVEEVRSRLTEGRAMEFFKRYRDVDGWRPRQAERIKPPKKPVMTGAQALLALQANMDDPWADEE
jgi:HK97 family phage prohead protease